MRVLREGPTRRRGGCLHPPSNTSAKLTALSRVCADGNSSSKETGQVDMDSIDLLVAQHRTMENLLRRVLDVSDVAAKTALFQEAADELTTHLSAEELLFYPAVKARRTEDILLESLEEHLSLKRLIADLLALAPSERTFEAKFKVLKEQAEHHHKEEEEHLFPKVRTLLDASEREELGSEMLAHQEQLRQEGEPRANVLHDTAAAARLD